MIIGMLFCWFPLVLWNIFHFFNVELGPVMCYILRTLKSTMPWSNPTINAGLYAFRIRRFRKDLKRLLYNRDQTSKYTKSTVIKDPT